MTKRPLRLFTAILAALVLAASCSTTRVLSEGEYRLARNKVDVTNSKSFDSGGLNQYIKQQPNSSFLGISPLVSIYNWASPEDNRFFARMCRKIGTPPVVYSPDAVESSIESMESHLEYIGYYNSKVTSDIRVNDRKVAVNYLVHLGKQYPIDSLSYTLPERGTFPEDFMEDLPNVSVKVGDILSEARLEEETVRGTAHFRDIGYYTFSKNNYIFEADTISVPGKLFLDMKVNEHSRNDSEDNAQVLRKFRVDSVTISHSGDLRFKDKILRELNTIRPGATYSENDVRTTYARLSALRLFSSVGIQMTQTDSNLVNCAINLSQSRLQGFKANLEASTNSTGLIGVSPELLSQEYLPRRRMAEPEFHGQLPVLVQLPHPFQRIRCVYRTEFSAVPRSALFFLQRSEHTAHGAQFNIQLSGPPGIYPQHLFHLLRLLGSVPQA